MAIHSQGLSDFSRAVTGTYPIEAKASPEEYSFGKFNLVHIRLYGYMLFMATDYHIILKDTHIKARYQSYRH